MLVNIVILNYACTSLVRIINNGQSLQYDVHSSFVSNRIVLLTKYTFYKGFLNNNNIIHYLIISIFDGVHSLVHKVDLPTALRVIV